MLFFCQKMVPPQKNELGFSTLKTSAYGNQSQSILPTSLAEMKAAQLREEHCSCTFLYGKSNIICIGREKGLSDGKSC